MKDATGQPQNSQTKCLEDAPIPKEKRRDTDQKSGKTRNATKHWRKAKCSETSQVQKAPAGSSLAINKGSKSKAGESTSDKI